MANILVCDRCGAKITDDYDNKIPYNSGQCIRTFNKLGRITYLKYDLCGKCDDELAEFLKKEGVNVWKNEN